jgi:hypothetical protein
VDVVGVISNHANLAVCFAARAFDLGNIVNPQLSEPSGEEVSRMLRIIQALYESAATGKAVPIPPVRRGKHAKCKNTMNTIVYPCASRRRRHGGIQRSAGSECGLDRSEASFRRSQPLAHFIGSPCVGAVGSPPQELRLNERVEHERACRPIDAAQSCDLLGPEDHAGHFGVLGSDANDERVAGFYWLHVTSYWRRE